MTIRTTIRNGRIELNAPKDLADGTDVLVELTPVSAGKIGLDESEWRDDQAALADWAAWLETIEPIAFAEDDSFTARFRQFNIDAVRKQMAEGVAE